jgi:pyruvate formate-lyase/glycerol dehydratase family glycyl radical enzyme
MATAVSQPIGPQVHLRRMPMEAIDAVDGFTPRVERLKQSYLDARTTVASDRAWFMMESYKKTEGDPPAIRRARALRNVLENMPIAIREDELLVGAPTPFVRGAHPNVELAPLNLESLLQQHEPPTAGSPAQQSHIEPEDKARLLAACEYWKHDYPSKRAEEMIVEFTGDLWRKLGEARMSMAPSPTALILTPGADYEKIFEIGFEGFIAEAREAIEGLRREWKGVPSGEDAEKIAFLESVIIVVEGMIRFAERHAELARELAESEPDPERKRELEEIAEVCAWVPAKPPRTFREALQTYWFLAVGHDIEKAISNAYVGRFDQYMWPFYERDINEGRMTRQQAGELLGCLFIKWSILEPFLSMGLLGDRQHQEIAQANYIGNVTLGGVTRDGRDAANELSCLVLQVAKQVKTHQPHISIRWHRAMSPEFLDKAIECNRDHGGGIPAWFSDRVGTEYLLDRGVKMDDARDWAMAGCINTAYPRSFGWVRPPVVNFVNHAKLVEMVLNDGVDPHTGYQLGPATGDPRGFRDFDELMEAYKEQIDQFYETSIRVYKHIEKVFYEDASYFPLASAFLQDCIQNGKDVTRGGGRYQQLEAGVIVDRGIQDASDSLLAMKKVIFEEKKATMDQLLEALKADFVGHEELRQRLLAAPKYGNDLEEPDELVASIWKYTVDKAQSYRDGEGRRFILFRQGAAWSTWAGRTTGALPNGRKAGTSLADASASPQQGCDVTGPTAAMNSVTKLDPMFMEGPLLNMKFAPGMLRSNEGRQKFAELLGTYFDQGGNHVQFNILDRATLLDAKAHPESYRNLVVRVAGYSAFWVELTPAVQDEIISRTEQAF